MAQYRVKNIDRSDWKEHPFMVIRNCNDEVAPNDGFWFWGSYDSIETAYDEAKSLCNGLLVETKDVIPEAIR